MSNVPQPRRQHRTAPPVRPGTRASAAHTPAWCQPDGVGCRVAAERCAFTLIELLTVVAIVGLLAALLLPALSAAREKAKAAKVITELHQIELALEMYAEEYGHYPPVRVSCNTSERDHWCQLPPELVEGRYLPSAGRNPMSSSMEDPFTPGHTYKYAAIGPYLLNGSPQEEPFAMYIPDDFPACRSPQGRYRDDPDAPLAWAVWSLGPRQNRDKALNPQAPLSALTWYRGSGDNGVIARIKARQGSSFQTP